MPDHTHDDDDVSLPPVFITLEDPHGTNNTVTLTQRTLGLSPYLLLEPSDNRHGINLTGARNTLEDAALFLAFPLVAILQSDDLDPETRAEVSEFVVDCLTYNGDAS